MTQLLDPIHTIDAAASARGAALADRLEQGARALIALARTLSPEQWRTRLHGDGRPVGVVVHHVASVYPIEVALARRLAAGESILDVTMDDVHAMNAQHARDHADVTKEEAIDLLARNSAEAAAAIRTFTDEELATGAPVALYGGPAPLTCQFVLEDHAVRHSYHHLARIKAALGR
jgi:hypothetical protein